MYRSKRTYGVVKPFSSRTSKHHRAKSDDEIICSYHEYGTKTKDDDGDPDREQHEETRELVPHVLGPAAATTPSTNALNAVKFFFNNSKPQTREEKEMKMKMKNIIKMKKSMKRPIKNAARHRIICLKAEICDYVIPIY